jgi:adenosine deaminase
MDFIEVLKIGDMEEIHKCPKTDLHNHFVIGGSCRMFGT